MRIVYFNKLKYSNISKSLPTISVKKGMIIDRTFALLILVTLNISIILNLSASFHCLFEKIQDSVKVSGGENVSLRNQGFHKV